MWNGVDALRRPCCDSAAMDTEHTVAGLAGQAIAKAVAVGENFDPQALRNHAHYVQGATGSDGDAAAFATLLHTTLLALALLAEGR